MKRTLRIFVGSSSEAEATDRGVKSLLKKCGVQPIGWREVFNVGDYPLEVLLNLSHSIDGAILIATPDDLTKYRKRTRLSPRDNIVLELGIFISQLGKRRTAILHVEPAELPSDVRGLTLILFDRTNKVVNEKRIQRWLEQVQNEVDCQHPSFPETLDLLRQSLFASPNAWHEDIERYVLKPFNQTLRDVSLGQVVLTLGQYYQAIYHEMDASDELTKVIAVSTLASEFWSKDMDQVHYARKNIEAAKRGADIRRLFVVTEREWVELHGTIQKQLEAGIRIRRATHQILTLVPSLVDIVLFSHTNGQQVRAYEAEHALNSPMRIKRGKLILKPEIAKSLIEIFEQAWTFSASVEHADLLEPSSANDTGENEPSLAMKSFRLPKPVITCIEAASAKRIPLRNELKTLIVKTQRGFVSLNLPGSARASLRAVKDVLEVDEALLASPAELAALGLAPGTVCAVRKPVWDLPQLISRSLLKLEFVSTNDGTLTGYYRFPPSILTDAKQVLIGKFEK